MKKLANLLIFGALALALVGLAAAGSYVPANQPYGAQVNPVFSYSASGSNVSTTGTITISTNQLTVANATGWGVGMGIAVANAGTGGNTELITSVTAMSGTTLTLAANAIATATAQQVSHDDTAALSSAMTTSMLSGAPLHLPVGNYNVTSGLISVTAPMTMYGDGENASIIWNRSKTANVLAVNYTSSSNAGIGISSLFLDFKIQQDTSVTPTAGSGISISGINSPNFVRNVHMDRVAVQGTWSGILVGSFVFKAWMSHLSIDYMVNGPGILINNPSPAGDVLWDSVALQGLNTGVTITSSDTEEFTNLKINGGQILFNAAANANIDRVRFVNPSVEGITGSPSCGIDFGTNGAISITIAAGEIGGFTTPICNMGTITGGLSITGVLEASSTFTNPVVLTYLPSIIANGAVPTGTGSCPINTQSGGNTAGKFSANGACAAGTVILTFATTATNGWVCDAHDQTTLTDAMNQSGSTQTTATFTGTMASADVMVFKCMAY